METNVIRESSLDVRALRVFKAVASTGSVSGGAKRLGITQSAVSQTLNHIEEILKTQVFDRTRRPFKLTAAGIALSRRASQIIEDVDRLAIHVRDADLASRPAIRIGMIDSFAATAGPAIVKEIANSSSQLLLWSGLASAHTNALLNRQLDLIVTSDTLEDVDKLVRRPIFTEPFVIVVPRTRIKEFQGANLMGLIDRAPLIRFSARSHLGTVVERHLRRSGHSPRPFLEIDASDVVMAMVASDLGWVISTPLCLLQGRVYGAQLAALPLPEPALSRTIYQISREGEYEETARNCLKASRRVLEDDIFPEVKKLIPWLGESMALC